MTVAGLLPGLELELKRLRRQLKERECSLVDKRRLLEAEAERAEAEAERWRPILARARISDGPPPAEAVLGGKKHGGKEQVGGGWSGVARG